jgi:RNA polymerase sigma-70 factor (ECF subfamily)
MESGVGADYDCYDRGKKVVENVLTRRAESPPIDAAIGRMHRLVEHLDAAYNLARWLLRNETEAEDAVQEAYLRAFHHSQSFRGGDSRAWLLTIVRNHCYDRLRQSRAFTHSAFEEKSHISGKIFDPESSLLRQETLEQVKQALENLPPQLREVLILREFEEMSYRQIAAAAEIPVGTVMSRLSRARQHLQEILIVEGRGTETQ